MKSAINFSYKYLLLILAAGFISSCNVTKDLKENQYMLVKNKIIIENPDKNVSTGDLESLIQQKPNKKFLGIVPIKLWFHSIFKKTGEPPVVLDRGLIEESQTQIKSYLSNIGYYDSEISFDIMDKGKKSRKVKYTVHLSQPYRIKNFNYEIEDDSIRYLVYNHRNNALVDSGSIFNSFTLDKERARLTDVLNNNGYFSFTRDYIYFEADSSVGRRQVDLTLRVRNPMEQDVNQPGNQKHKIYYINKVYIYPDYRPFVADSMLTDTLTETTNRAGSDIKNKYKVIYHSPLKIKPNVILRSLFLENYDKYSRLDATQSYKKLNELRIFKYVDINFRESEHPPAINPGLNYLDCTVRLTRNPVNSYSIEAQGTNSGGDLGIGGYLVFQNKNLFHGGEVFHIRLKGAVEAQEQSATDVNPSDNFLFFNTYEAGIEATLYIPKFLAPINEDVFSKYFRPKTYINLGYNIQNRIEYDRVITNATFGYEWSETKFKQHILYPIDVNVIKMNTTASFDELLAQESQRFQNQYTDHLIMGLRYSYIFSNQELNKIKNFLYFRGNFESSGNLLNLLVKTTGQKANDEGFNTLFGIRYSQYLKVNLDARYYFRIDKEKTFAIRGFGGIAVPYGNSVDIPFEKGYFGGGANGMRAWPLRYLGPGAFQNSSAKNIERVGDIMLEANIEYRFPIYKIFTGAFFYDIGNIWLLYDNESYPGGKFYFKKFPGQLAMDAGLGIRLDFNYFIFRIDFAQRIKDPAKEVGDRWVIGNTRNWFNPVLNLGIGYPF